MTDGWEGLEQFFLPGSEILRVDTVEDVLQTVCLSDTELQRVSEAARERVLRDHTNERRVMDLEESLSALREPLGAQAQVPAQV